MNRTEMKRTNGWQRTRVRKSIKSRASFACWVKKSEVLVKEFESDHHLSVLIAFTDQQVLYFTMWRQGCCSWQYTICGTAITFQTDWMKRIELPLKTVCCHVIGLFSACSSSFIWLRCEMFETHRKSSSTACLYSSPCCWEARCLLGGDVKVLLRCDLLLFPRDTLFPPQVSAEEVNLCAKC